MSVVAIITARGGSKRIPRKNIKHFLGKPIIAYSIEVALASSLFDEVMVSTDDKEIADYARECGATVPFMRSPESSNDSCGTAEVILEVLDRYKHQGKTFSEACCIYPTAPFITTELLTNAHTMLTERALTSVFPVAQYSAQVLRGLKREHGKTTMAWPENLNCRSQDLQPLYYDAGQFYFINSKQFLDSKVLYSDNSDTIVIDDLSAQDIDNESDWLLAEMKYRFKDRNN